MRVGAIFGGADNLAANLHIAVRIVRIDNREGDRRTHLQRARLDPAARRIDPNLAVGDNRTIPA